jgi:hypothetical protein
MKGYPHWGAPPTLWFSMLQRILLSWLAGLYLGGAGAPAANAADTDGPVPYGGGACVMAKWMGQTMDYVLVVGKDHPQAAVEEGERLLIAKGYGDYRARGSRVDVIHAQAITALPQAYVMVIKSEWSNWRGKPRTNYGCGFSADSYDDALWAAIRDLQNHAWGWKPDRDGYQLIEKRRY